MKKLILASNMFQEADQMDRWWGWVSAAREVGVVDGVLIVDSGSVDGTPDRCREEGAVVVTDDIIQREGYGPARNQLRGLARESFEGVHWVAYFDADEVVDEAEFHVWRFLKDYLNEERFDVVAFPRIDWMDDERTASDNDYHVKPDWQARMTRVDSPIEYYRRVHEQVRMFRGIYSDTRNPKINHFHRSAGQDRRDLIGRLCAKLHMEDSEYGHEVPEHHKEAYYREQLLKKGLLGDLRQG